MFFMVLSFQFSRHVDRRANGGNQSKAGRRELHACGEMGEKGQEKRCARCSGSYEADEYGMVVHFTFSARTQEPSSIAATNPVVEVFCAKLNETVPAVDPVCKYIF